MIRTVVVGASGYSGAELLRLAAGHPELEVVAATGETHAGSTVASVNPNLTVAYPELRLERFEPALLDDADLVLLALPHGTSQQLMPEVLARDLRVVDLAADFRLHDPAAYPAWYGEEHRCPELLERFAYGLPELHRKEILGARAVAAPGCYPTAAALALEPLVAAGAVETSGIVVDAASGVSGAGRPPKPTTSFCEVDADLRAYGLLDHRHTPEIEQCLGGAQVLFTPHLVPMSRGILATCYARPSSPTSSDDLLACLRARYEAEPFVVVTEAPPSTKATLGSNTAHVTVRSDPRTGWVVALAAIDNLVKGAAGQALQCANLLFGLEEGTGLPVAGVHP